jgi:hypothetical protein
MGAVQWSVIADGVVQRLVLYHIYVLIFGTLS